MDDKELQSWVERISIHSFGLPFKHKATFNKRLRATGGRYFMKTHNIEINPHQLEAYGAEEVEKIIKHELCHYHLHLQRKGYRHRDPDFKALLARVGGSRYCRSLPSAQGRRRPEPYRYKLVCARCGTEYPRKRKVDPRRFACGKCRGPLRIYQILPLDFHPKP
ncbi:SprT family protein [Paenibacillus sp. MSJ-34]|uniref:SprT family protein n=1 Tax=Paenibacillus sp. MSJ-34 TaxID=2841529 RepID=UPI001C10B4EC|nr:SprT family protein [Paenibacillus sp. MSJ-34]MBU5443408.1 SprT family protein [Paenibacillus sp. MSJ-34]